MDISTMYYYYYYYYYYLFTTTDIIDALDILFFKSRDKDRQTDIIPDSSMKIVKLSSTLKKLGSESFISTGMLS